MSYQKVLKLAQQFNEKIRNEQFSQQRQKMEQFSNDFMSKLYSVINEMDGDVATLKEKEFDQNSIKKLHILLQKILGFYKNFDEKKPYVWAEKLIQYIISPDIFPIIQSLNINIQKHLKENQIQFLPSNKLSQARVDSIKNLLNLLFHTKDYMKKNPLLPDPRDMPTVRPPALEVPPGPEYNPVGPEAATNPGKKI